MKSLKTLLVAISFLATGALGHAAGPFAASVMKMTPDADAAGPKYCATTKGLFKRSGKAWERIESLGLARVTAVAVSTEAIVAAVQLKGVFASYDKGATWVQLTEGLRSKYGRPVDEVLDLAADPVDPSVFYLGSAGKGFFATKDKGKTWSLWFDGLESATPAAQHVTSILPASKDRPLMIGTDGDGVFAWKGNKWIQATGGLPKVLKVTKVTEAPGDPKRLILSSSFEGLWESRDGGQSWKMLYKGQFGVATAAAVGNNGAAASFFGQEGIVVLEEGARPKVNYLGYSVVKDMLARPGGGYFVAFVNDGVKIADQDGKITGNDNAGLNAATIRSFVDDADKKGLWAGDTNGVFYTADGGKTWEERDKGLVTGDVTGLLWLDGKLYAGTAGQGVFLWDPAKSEWIFRGKALGTSNTIYAMDKTPDGKIYVSTEGGILWTADGGVNWTRASNGLKLSRRLSVAADSKKAGHLWAANGTSLYETKDGGENWTELFAGEYSDVRFGAGALYVAGGPKVYKLAAGKLDVLYVNPAEPPQAILPTQDALLVGTEKGLARVKGGKTASVWSEAGVTAIHVDGGGKVWAGSDGRGANVVKVK